MEANGFITANSEVKGTMQVRNIHNSATLMTVRIARFGEASALKRNCSWAYKGNVWKVFRVNGVARIIGVTDVFRKDWLNWVTMVSTIPDIWEQIREEVVPKVDNKVVLLTQNETIYRPATRYCLRFTRCFEVLARWKIVFRKVWANYKEI